MSPILDYIQEKVYERTIPYFAILGHSGSNRELLYFNRVIPDTKNYPFHLKVEDPPLVWRGVLGNFAEAKKGFL